MENKLNNNRNQMRQNVSGFFYAPLFGCSTLQVADSYSYPTAGLNYLWRVEI
jgi:hypothetical protein